MIAPAQRDRPDVQAERAAFVAQMRTLDPQRLVFVDEPTHRGGCGIRQGERLAYGYAARGARCRAGRAAARGAPLRKGKRRNLVGWMRAGSGQVASFDEEPVTAALFTRFVEVSLAPQLKPGDVVIWDNARVHAPEAVSAVEAKRATVLALPRYSPELNAIEPFWGKLKQDVRSRQADTREALGAAVGAALGRITDEDVAGWIEHCGYARPPT